MNAEKQCSDQANEITMSQIPTNLKGTDECKQISKENETVDSQLEVYSDVSNSLVDVSVEDTMSNIALLEQTNPIQVKLKGVKSRKKDDCSVQHVLRALNSLTTPEEKLAAMCKKYADLFDENRKFQSNLKQSQKQIAVVMKERDQVRTDLAKSVLTRSRLENLCRELQRQNKIIKEESFQKIREEEEKRKEVSAKFQVTLNEITELMKQDSDKTMKLRDDNIDMTSKLKSIYEQYEIREQQIEKMAKQMALESQLSEAKIAKLEMETSAEKEVLLREKQHLLMTLTEYQARFQEYQNIEMALRSQVALYNNKYEEFEKSLTRSNQMFGGFKEEMETMSNKIVKLESETETWKQRWEKTQKALLEMASEKKKSDHEVIMAAKQMATLHKLCRTLQTERSQLLAKLKQNDISVNCSVTSDSQSFENNLSVETSNVNPNKLNESNKNKNSGKSKACDSSNNNDKISKGTKKKNIETSKLYNKTNGKSETIEGILKIKTETNKTLKSEDKCSKNKDNTATKNCNELNTDQEIQNASEDIAKKTSNLQIDSKLICDNNCLSLGETLDNAHANIVDKLKTKESTINAECVTVQIENIPSDITTEINEQSHGITSKNNSTGFIQIFSQNSCEDASEIDNKQTLANQNEELKQFSFPQTDTFSFTYNGNVLNEIKCNQEIPVKNGYSLLESEKCVDQPAAVFDMTSSNKTNSSS